MKKQITALLSGLGLLVLATSCNTDKSQPGYIYMPDMTYSQAYETYTETDLFENGMSTRKPVANTIPRGFMPFHFEESNSEYERAGREVKNPLEVTDAVLANGKYNFEIYCAVCHGKEGKGNGAIVERGVYPPPPSYFSDNLLNLSDGKMFYSIHFGKNLMGSYRTQLNQKERWEVISYIRSMQKEYLGGDSEGTDVASSSDNNMNDAIAEK